MGWSVNASVMPLAAAAKAAARLVDTLVAFASCFRYLLSLLAFGTCFRLTQGRFRSTKLGSVGRLNVEIILKIDGRLLCASTRRGSLFSCASRQSSPRGWP